MKDRKVVAWLLWIIAVPIGILFFLISYNFPIDTFNQMFITCLLYFFAVFFPAVLFYGGLKFYNNEW